MAISMLKIRRPLGRLIFNMGIAIPGKTVFLIETAPWMWKWNIWQLYKLGKWVLWLRVETSVFDYLIKHSYAQDVEMKYMTVI